jgi:Spy/CpxP family protein refolding chaperone
MELEDVGYNWKE